MADLCENGDEALSSLNDEDIFKEDLLRGVVSRLNILAIIRLTYKETALLLSKFKRSFCAQPPNFKMVFAV